MKKSLIALAVLAASGAALAQSSVTIYGRLDASVGSMDKIGAGSDTKLFSGGEVGLTTPRLGFIGKEDLGGGLKATFKLEQRIDIDTGALQNPSFKGESSVGLAGGFGAVRMGRMTTPFDDARALSNKYNVFDSNGFTPTAAVFKTGGANADYSSRNNGMIRYDSPSFGGVSGSVSHAFEQTAGADDTVTSLLLGYKDGGLNVALGFQDEKTKQEYTQLAASYDFGTFALSGGYSTRKADAAANGKDTEYNLGVEVLLHLFRRQDHHRMGPQVGVQGVTYPQRRIGARQIKMGHLSQGVHTGIGPPGALDRHRLLTESQNRSLDDLLHGKAIGLALPPDERAAIVFKRQFIARHDKRS